MRIGIGYDLHRLSARQPLILGGVGIVHDRGPLGHSDGDVVLHALCDALLGAAGLGDIGELFPDTDPAWRGADSRRFVEDVRKRVSSAGYGVTNVDVIIHAEKPRLGDSKTLIKQSIADMLGLSAEAVCVKAKTNEGLDAVGRGAAVACWVAVLLHEAGGAG